MPVTSLKTGIFLPDGMHLNSAGYDLRNPIVGEKIGELIQKGGEFCRIVRTKAPYICIHSHLQESGWNANRCVSLLVINAWLRTFLWQS